MTFLVQVNHNQPDSHWEVSRTLHLSPMFGLYRLKDADDQYHACQPGCSAVGSSKVATQSPV